MTRSMSHAARNSRSTPNLTSEAASASEPLPPDEPQDSGFAPGGNAIHATIQCADMSADETVSDPAASIVVFYEVTVTVGLGQELGSARRRYREFLQLHRLLQQRYPRLLSEEHEELPPFPPKTFLRAGWEPEVVVTRLRALGAWLTTVTDKLQYVSPELISFLNVPMYCAVRMLSGDLSAADLVEPCSLPCSPDTVMANEPGARAGSPLSPHTDHSLHLCGVCASDGLHAIATGLRHSIERPGYNECAMHLARALCAYAAEAGLASPPTLDETHRLVRSICVRALFKPCSLLAAVVYLERMKPSMRHTLLQSDGWALTALVVLVIAAKVYDSDVPISNADVCAPCLLPPYAGVSGAHASARPVSMRRVNECERRVLVMLDYCTVVSRVDFARAYLTLPFAFPSVPRSRPHGDAAGSTRPPRVPKGGASADCLRPEAAGGRKSSLRELAARQLMGLSIRQVSLP